MKTRETRKIEKTRKKNQRNKKFQTPKNLLKNHFK